LLALEIRVSPEDAKVTLDGAPITTPFTGKFRQDGSLHHLEVNAEHYRSAKQLVSFDGDHVIDVVLERAHEHVPNAIARRVRGADKPAPASPIEAPARAEAPPPARSVESSGMEPGADLKSGRPRISRRNIDAVDPYSTSN
jgi:hypothetical protein